MPNPDGTSDATEPCVAELLKQVDDLRGALAPFARAGTGISGDWPDSTRGGVPGEVPFCPPITAGDFRRAARVMGLKISEPRKLEGV
jgi:hypothetical protein